jgi:hypothetical protein
MKQDRILTSISNATPNGEGLNALPILFVTPSPTLPPKWEKGD